MRLLIIILFLLSAGVFRSVTAQEDVGFVSDFRSDFRSYRPGEDGLPASRYLTSIHFKVLLGGSLSGRRRSTAFPTA
ncbi:hypothetical protein ACQ86N_34980 [Puia sp. P3]|uniref:hypothetical protein n=1 Tax=Puia sp. P3 TaxID=3423952 RepID=UPI003D67B359